MADPILPDYRLSVEQVYISVASLMVLNIHTLSTLSQVEDKGKCNLPDLPSWVPDWSCDASCLPLTWRDASGAFNASLVDNNASLFLPQVFETTLVVSGADFDRVVETCSYYPDKSGPLDPPKSLLLCMDLPKNPSNTTQSRLEMLWRTMITDYDSSPAEREKTPAPETMVKLFFCWMSLKTTKLAAIAGPAVCILILECLTELADSTLMQSQVPSANEIVKICRLFKIRKESGVEKLSGEQEKLLQTLERESVPFFSQVTQNAGDRCLYRTENGHLGLGPESIAIGDQVWLIQGARVPFILRARQDTAYTLMGETYLHGCMRGEMMTPDLRERIGPVHIR